VEALAQPAERGSAARAAAGARERLLAAALARFQADGAIAATLEDIRRDAGVSVGALYHHFPDKTALAAALYGELIDDFQDGFLAQLREHTSAEQGVKDGVRCYLRWVGQHRAAAAFLLSERPQGAGLRERDRRFFAAVMAWWRTHVHYRQLRELPLPVINAIWLGPAHEYVRHWLAGTDGQIPRSVTSTLAETAWRSLKEER